MGKDLPHEHAPASSQPTHVLVSLMGGGVAIQPSRSQIIGFVDKPFRSTLFLYRDNRQATQPFQPVVGLFVGMEDKLIPTFTLQTGIEYIALDTPRRSAQVTTKQIGKRLPITIGEESMTRIRERPMTYLLDYAIQSQALFVESKALLSASTTLRPYALVAGGMSAHQIGRARGGAAPPNTRTFAYQLGVGLDYRVNSHWRLSLAYRWIHLGSVQPFVSADAFSFDDTDIMDPLEKQQWRRVFYEFQHQAFKLYNHTLTVQLSYVF